MVSDKIIKELADVFSFLKKEDILAVLVFGSLAKEEEYVGDTDICIVAPEMKSKDVLRKVFGNVDVKGKNLDVYCFEELPLNLKWEVIFNHKIVWAGDEAELGEYFYFFRKLYDDQKHRMKISREEILKMLEKHKSQSK